MPQLPVLLLKFEDAHHSVQIDAFVLTEVLRLHEPVDVPQTVPSRTAFRAPRHHEPLPVVLTQGLG